MTREQKVEKLIQVIQGKAPKSTLKPNPTLNVNMGSLADGKPRFELDGMPINMARVFEAVYNENINYTIK